MSEICDFDERSNSVKNNEDFLKGEQIRIRVLIL